jgi:hypothetical protein
VLWETICLTTKTEACGENCSDVPFQGRGYIQLTGQANYQEFANYINDQSIISNPNQVALYEGLAWRSALYFWNRNCNGIESIGAGTRCINSLECEASVSESSVYFQFAPSYRLQLGLALGFGDDTSLESTQACIVNSSEWFPGYEGFCVQVWIILN